MKKIFIVVLALLLTLFFVSCGKEEPFEDKAPEISEKAEEPVVPEQGKNEPGYGENGERREVSAEDYKNAVEIVLSENITVGGKPAEESDSVVVGGEIIYYHDMEKYPSGNPYGKGGKKDMHTEEEAAGHTLVTIKKPGEYFIKGELKGQIAVDLGENAKNNPSAKVTLIFGGADITCEIAPAVIFYNVYECERLSAEASEKPDTSKAGANIIVVEGSLNNIKGANVAKIFKDDDGENKLHKYDAAVYSRMSFNIDGAGTINIEAKNEGIGSEMHLTVNGGIINVSSMDDGINVNEDEVSVVTINGGKLTVKGGLGTEGDGIDSNGWLVINGGEICSSGNKRSSDGGVDADKGIIINGGKLVAFGNKNDGISSDSKQLFVRLEFDFDQNEKNKIEFVDSEGKGVVFENDREFRSLVVSSPDLEENVEYKLYVNGIMQEYTSDVDKYEQFIEGFMSAFTNEENFGLENKSEDKTLFLLTEKTRYFSGIFDSSKATGKERVEFTIDGKTHFEDIFKGDIPEIGSIECSENIPLEHVIISLTYEGRAEDINVSRSCLLSEGYYGINRLFENLEEGSYCLRISVSKENPDYSGISEFDFMVVS